MKERLTKRKEYGNRVKVHKKNIVTRVQVVKYASVGKTEEGKEESENMMRMNACTEGSEAWLSYEGCLYCPRVVIYVVIGAVVRRRVINV